VVEILLGVDESIREEWLADAQRWSAASPEHRPVAVDQVGSASTFADFQAR